MRLFAATILSPSLRPRPRIPVRVVRLFRGHYPHQRLTPCGMVLLLWMPAIVLVGRLFCGRHVDVQRGAQIDFMLLLLRDDPAQRLA